MRIRPEELLALEFIRPEDRLLIAFSGGPDSMALLDLLLELQKEIPFVLKALHFDHGLRPSSNEEALWAQQFCRENGVPCAIQKLDLHAYADREGSGLEGAGHVLRKKALKKYARAQRCSLIALGHHADDQAETFLLNLLRGSGIDGLSAMSPLHDGFWRPLLAKRKKDLIAYCKERGLDYILDPSNADRAFVRNAFRHDIIPLMEELNPQAVPHILHASLHLQEERELLENLADQHYEDLACKSDGSIRFKQAHLQALSPALIRRLILRAVRTFVPEKNLFQAQMQSILDLTEGKVQGQIDLGDSLIAWKSGPILSIERREQEESFFDAFLWEMEEHIIFPDGTKLKLSEGKYSPDPRKKSLWLPEKRTFLIRPPKAGDRIKIKGLGSKKIKDLFREARISPHRRKTWHLLCDPGDDRILWIPSLAIAADMQHQESEALGVFIKYEKN